MKKFQKNILSILIVNGFLMIVLIKRIAIRKIEVFPMTFTAITVFSIDDPNANN
jgi:hypothetical protein